MKRRGFEYSTEVSHQNVIRSGADRPPVPSEAAVASLFRGDECRAGATARIIEFEKRRRTYCAIGYAAEALTGDYVDVVSGPTVENNSK